MNTIITKPIIKINTDELDMSMIEDILGDVEDRNEIYKGNTAFINTPIKIDTLRKYLDELESKGANYVSIDFHIDHIEYELDGIKISEATQEEIDEHNKEQRQNNIDLVKHNISVLEKQKSQFEERLKQLTGEE